MFYSKSTGGFYDTAIHGDNIPADAVEVTAEQHATLIQGQSQGKRIVADEAGHPVLADPPKPTKSQLLAARQSEAAAYLSSTDWYLAHKVETGQEVSAKRAQARADLN